MYDESSKKCQTAAELECQKDRFRKAFYIILNRMLKIDHNEKRQRITKTCTATLSSSSSSSFEK
ncbi:hypothetical protein DERF_015816 [Dermatophagoides farinae]|uniref:Uncharacterized protein n=1 Tax=Dermatophagoides farinae TaxID=6954 RepID=A0A922L0P2_DERFA|nr:hypothetical protein DERF_015816 [Dermatophagoides farinae]